MDNKVFEKLDKLVREGKISLRERNELEEAMGFRKGELGTKLGTPKKVECSYTGSIDMEITGDDSIQEVIVDEGNDIIETTLEGDTLKISNKSFRKIFFNYFESQQCVKIRLPRNTPSVEIKLVSGDLSAKNLQSNFSVSIVSGDVRISDLTGKLNVNALSGDISIDKFNGELEVVTKSGDIKLENSKIKGQLKTYSGDIVTRSVDFVGFKISTFSGDLELESASFQGNGEISTYFGDIHVNGNLSNVYVKADTLHGNIDIRGTKPYNESLNKGENVNEIIAKTKSGDICVKDTSKGG